MSDLPKDVKRAASTALVRVCWHIYCQECWDPKKKNWIIAYIGTSLDEVRRVGQHKNLVSGASRVVAARCAYGNSHVRSRHLFSYGIESFDYKENARDAHALETYLMQKHNTKVPECRSIRERMSFENREFDHKWPDICLLGQPRNFQWNCNRSCVDEQHIAKWGAIYEQHLAGKETTVNVEPEEVAEVMAAVEKAFALAVKEGEGVRGEPTAEELGTELVVCEKKKTMEVITFTIDTPFMVAFNLVDKYEKMDPWRVVKREDFLSDLDLINDESLKMHDADVASFVRMFKLSCHTDKHDKFDMQMTAREAAGLLISVHAWLGTKEEALYAASEDKDTKKHYEWACELLAFVRGNEGKMPSQKPTEDSRSTEEQKAERTLGTRLRDWLSGWNGRDEKRQQCNLYLVILRHFPSFVFRVRGGLAEQSANLIEELNAKLLAGFGIKERMKTFMPHVRQLQRNCPECGAKEKVYTKLMDWFSGNHHKDTDDILAGLPPNVANAMRAIHDANVESTKAKRKEADKKKTADLHARGIVNAFGKRKERE